MSHTPGPWRAVEWSDGMRVLMPSSVYVCADIGNPRNPEAHANARLIAAAPEMLAALKGMMASPVGDYEAAKAAQSAIAKAEGTAVHVEGSQSQGSR